MPSSRSNRTLLLLNIVLCVLQCKACAVVNGTVKHALRRLAQGVRALTGSECSSGCAALCTTNSVSAVLYKACVHERQHELCTGCIVSRYLFALDLLYPVK